MTIGLETYFCVRDLQPPGPAFFADFINDAYFVLSPD